MRYLSLVALAVTVLVGCASAQVPTDTTTNAVSPPTAQVVEDINPVPLAVVAQLAKATPQQTEEFNPVPAFVEAQVAKRQLPPSVPMQPSAAAVSPIVPSGRLPENSSTALVPETMREIHSLTSETNQLIRQRGQNLQALMERLGAKTPAELQQRLAEVRAMREKCKQGQPEQHVTQPEPPASQPVVRPVVQQEQIRTVWHTPAAYRSTYGSASAADE